MTTAHTTTRPVTEPCREPEFEPEVTCDQAADHTCSDGVARCRSHCTCRLDKPTQVDVAVVLSFEDVTDPVAACRAFLADLRRVPHAYHTVHFEVTPVDGGETMYLSFTGAQQLRTSVYTEAEPLGPTDAGDAGGPAQMSTAYVRRFIRPLDDGVHFCAVDVECMVVNANDGDPDAPERLVLSQSFGWTVCTDPTDPTGSEVRAYTSYARDLERPAGAPPFTDADAFALCAEFDPSALTWAGEPVEGTYHPQ